MIRHFFRWSLTGTGFAMIALGLVRGQAPLQPKPGEEAVLGAPIESQKVGGKDANRLSELRYGKKPVNDPDKNEAEANRAVISKSARWHAYRITHPQYQGQGEFTPNDLVQEANRQLLLIPAEIRKKGLSPDQQIYLKEFATDFTKCLQEVLTKNSKFLVRVNAARLLAAAAEAGHEEAADLLVQLLENEKENDGVKFWALRGLKELFAQGSTIKDEKREARCILALHRYINAKPGLSAGASPEEVNGYRYVRREAVRALSETRFASVPKNEDKGRTALLLLKVARKDGLTPEPSLYEQVEAAIGLCQLQLDKAKDYNPDYVAQHVGAVVVEFVNQFNRQRLASEESSLPWKLYSLNLMIALDKLKATAQAAPGKGAQAYVDTTVDLAKKTLAPIDLGKGDPDPTGLDNWVRKPAPSASVYSSVKDSVVKPGQ